MEPRDFKLGNELLDRQHARMYMYLDILKEEYFLNRAEFDSITNFLIDYVHKHFKDEEELMLSLEYPYYELHKKLHDEFREKIIKMAIDFKNDFENIDEEKYDALIDSLVEWLNEHIMKVDRYIRHYLK